MSGDVAINVRLDELITIAKAQKELLEEIARQHFASLPPLEKSIAPDPQLWRTPTDPEPKILGEVNDIIGKNPFPDFEAEHPHQVHPGVDIIHEVHPDTVAKLEEMGIVKKQNPFGCKHIFETNSVTGKKCLKCGLVPGRRKKNAN